MKRLLALALLLPAPAMAQQPSPAQVGITTAVPNVVQVYDSSHNWATIGTIDPVTHIFNVAGYTPYVLPTASTTVLGGVKVDGSTININGSGVISGTPPAITANSTPTSGFAAGQVMYSDGSKTQPVHAGVATNWGDATYPLYIFGGNNTVGMPLHIEINGNGLSDNAGVSIFSGNQGNGVELPSGPAVFTYNGFLGFITTSNSSTTQPDVSFTAMDTATAGFRNLGAPTSPESLRVYNTLTDFNNGEWGAFDWRTVANTLTVGAQANGTGTQRPVNIVGNPVTINGAALPNGTITANTTPTSGFAANRLLMSDGAKVQQAHDTVVNWSSNPSYPVYTGGRANYPATFFINGLGNVQTGVGFNTFPGQNYVIMTMNDGTYLASSMGFVFNTNDVGSYPEIAFMGDGPGIAAFRDQQAPTVASALRVYNTYTDASNGEWGAMDWKTVPNTLTIGTQANGTGTLRPVNIVGSTVTVNGAAIGGGSISFPQVVAGTTNSGGIPYFSDATHLSSSAALAASALMVGGGAGVAPSTITTGAGVNAVLGVAPNTNGGIDTSSTSSIVVGAIETGGGSGVAGIGLADVATGSYLRSGGVTTIPAWQAFGTGAQTAVNTAINTTGGLVTQSGTLAAGALLLGGGSATAITSTTTGTGVVTALGVNTGSTGAMVLQTAPGVTQAGFVSNGTQPTITGSGGTCATTTKVGGATAGTVVLSAVCASTNTIVWTGMPTAPNGWACDATDRTTRTAGPFIESASTTTGFTLTVGSTSSVAADVLQWKCQGY